MDKGSGGRAVSDNGSSSVRVDAMFRMRRRLADTGRKVTSRLRASRCGRRQSPGMGVSQPNEPQPKRDR